MILNQPNILYFLDKLFRIGKVPEGDHKVYFLDSDFELADQKVIGKLDEEGKVLYSICYGEGRWPKSAKNMVDYAEYDIGDVVLDREEFERIRDCLVLDASAMGDLLLMLFQHHVFAHFHEVCEYNYSFLVREDFSIAVLASEYDPQPVSWPIATFYDRLKEIVLDGPSRVDRAGFEISSGVVIGTVTDPKSTAIINLIAEVEDSWEGVIEAVEDGRKKLPENTESAEDYAEYVYAEIFNADLVRHACASHQLVGVKQIRQHLGLFVEGASIDISDSYEIILTPPYSDKES